MKIQPHQFRDVSRTGETRAHTHYKKRALTCTHKRHTTQYARSEHEESVLLEQKEKPDSFEKEDWGEEEEKKKMNRKASVSNVHNYRKPDFPTAGQACHAIF